MLIQVSTLSTVGEGLDLAILGKVESSNFLSFLNLLLERLYFSLELVDQGLHSLSILSVFILSILGILHLGFKKFLISFKHHCSVLFHAELISETGSINHCFLGFVFRHMSFTCHFIQIMSKIVHLLLTLTLSSTDSLVLASLVTKSFI